MCNRAGHPLCFLRTVKISLILAEMEGKKHRYHFLCDSLRKSNSTSSFQNSSPLPLHIIFAVCITFLPALISSLDLKTQLEHHQLWDVLQLMFPVSWSALVVRFGVSYNDFTTGLSQWPQATLPIKTVRSLMWVCITNGVSDARNINGVPLYRLLHYAPQVAAANPVTS